MSNLVVTESRDFNICCVITVLASLVCLTTCFCTGRILSLVRNCIVTCSLDRLSLFLAASATSVCFCSFGGTTGLGGDFTIAPFVICSLNSFFRNCFATIITSYCDRTVLGTSCINFSCCGVLVVCSRNSLSRNDFATIITSYCSRTGCCTSCLNGGCCLVFVSTSVSYFDSCNSRLTVCCCTRVANGKCYGICVVNFYNSTRFNDCTIECKASALIGGVSNLYRNNSCACR